MLDDTKTLRNIVVTWTLQFNDVLDPELLHISLLRLLEIGDWRKVGGRLRLWVCCILIFNYLVILTSKYRIVVSSKFTSLNLSPKTAPPYLSPTNLFQFPSKTILLRGHYLTSRKLLQSTRALKIFVPLQLAKMLRRRLTTSYIMTIRNCLYISRLLRTRHSSRSRGPIH
jgi:hypothetical protein